jgi:triosephosphate isomerase
MKKIVASNFKTNHTRSSTKEFVEETNSYIKSNGVENDIYIFPPSTALDNFNSVDNLTVGAQNCYPVKDGSFTGEIGTSQLEEFGVKTILIGHSERRHILAETQSSIVSKFQYFKELGYKIVYCVGEPLSEKEKGFEHTLTYIWQQLNGIDLDYENLVIAYEPVWAIGSGISARLYEIDEVHKSIKEHIKAPLLYGGSVNIGNVKGILELESVDGVLVGTSSWDLDNFKKMIEIAKEVN